MSRRKSWCLSSLFYSTDEREFQPFPVAVHVGEADFAEPAELKFDTGELVRRVFVRGGDAEGLQKPGVEVWRRGGNVLEIAKDTARGQRGVDLGIERLLPRVRAVMDGKARDDCVEESEVGQGMVEIMFDYSDLVVATESFTGGFQHDGRKVERDALSAG